jgi:hypothetical protein
MQVPLHSSLTAGEYFCGNVKAARLGRFQSKRRNRKENLSGKAMQDEVPAHAKTHGLKKSQSLEEG